MTRTSQSEGETPIISAIGISKRFDVPRRLRDRLMGSEKPRSVRALDNVNLEFARGEVVGLVGESGCGKSTFGRIIAGIMQPSEGDILWKGRSLKEMNAHEQKSANLRTQMIFQDPMSSLNPRKRVAEIIGTAPYIHGLVSRGDLAGYVDDQLRQAGLDPALKRRYPHQFSGGQRQRIGIARALAVQPEFLVCDESVASLDVSIQAQIVNLFMSLRDKLNLTYLFISHDIGVIRHVSDRVLVMYLGRVVESAKASDLFANPNHPYTQSLLATVPRLEHRRKPFAVVQGEIPSPLNPPAGCHFHPRCPFAQARCRVERPELKSVGAGHSSACHLNDRSQ
jgi:oligopeptide/dipeptide ABC transporter ATP-binding protein